MMERSSLSTMLRLALIFAGTVFASAAIPANARPIGHEAQALMDTLLAPPVIKPERGFKAKMLIPPGELYDPLFMLPYHGTILLNDDGKEIRGHGSRMLEVTPHGKLTTLMDADQLLPVIGFDLAPSGFGAFAGQIFALAQPATAMAGAMANHVIERIDLTARTALVFCTLPTAGSVGKGVAGIGNDARFGPAGSGFANLFFSLTGLNYMIYQTSPDGSCKPFADTAQYGSPAGVAFTPDGSAMLVTAAPELLPSATSGPKGVILRITPDGKIDPKPVVTGLVGGAGMAIAPPGFGDYAGQIFVADVGDFESPVPQTQPLKRDGKIYRVTQQGELKLVASGFVNPLCLRFIDNHLWVTDVNGDFILGMRELPDGFLVQLDLD
jgi:hypothetical protein